MTVQKLALAPDSFPQLTNELATLFPASVAVAVTDPTEPRSAAFAEEAACLPPMRALRRREFLAGRHALRRAMNALGRASEPVPMNPDRSPALPQGLAASISHTATLCVAVAGHAHDSAGLGIDLEPESALDPALWSTICTRADMQLIGATPEAERGRLARRIFSAKEAAYKAQFALSRTLLDFDAFDITFPADGVFAATFRKPVGPFATGDRIAGRWAHLADHIVTTARIPA